MEVFTPNTGQCKNLVTGEERVRGDNWTKGEKGLFTGSKGSSDGKSAKKVDKFEESGIIKIGKTFEDYSNNPELLGESVPSQKFDYYSSHGYDVRPLGDGNFKGIPFDKGGGFRVFFDTACESLLMYHPEERSHHKAAYYKLSRGKNGKRRFKLDGTPLED